MQAGRRKRAEETDRIRADEPTNAAYWCRQFGCTELELRRAVKDAGDAPDDVRAHLMTKWLNVPR